MASPHDKLIANAAKEVLEPFDFRRKGRSRTWIQDHGWWLAIVEFQPSNWTKGSYLNVAANWLWREKDYISFDYGGRLDTFVEYQSDDQFVSETNRLVRLAVQEATRLAQTFASIETTATALTSQEHTLRKEGRGSWSAYNAGMAMGLAARMAEAEAMFRSVSDERVLPAAARVFPALHDVLEFKRLANELIQAQRKALGFDPI